MNNLKVEGVLSFAEAVPMILENVGKNNLLGLGL
jgi:hypothetical protein